MQAAKPARKQQTHCSSSFQVCLLSRLSGDSISRASKRRCGPDKAARTATRIGHVTAYSPAPLLKNGGLWYPGRHWINVFPGNANFTSNTFDYIDARTFFFTYASSASPARNRLELKYQRLR
jgi:hypothetical protein